MQEPIGKKFKTIFKYQKKIINVLQEKDIKVNAMRKSIQDMKTGFSKEIKLVKTNQTEMIQKMQTHLGRLIAW